MHFFCKNGKIIQFYENDFTKMRENSRKKCFQNLWRLLNFPVIFCCTFSDTSHSTCIQNSTNLACKFSPFIDDLGENQLKFLSRLGRCPIKIEIFSPVCLHPDQWVIFLFLSFRFRFQNDAKYFHRVFTPSAASNNVGADFSSYFCFCI